jgi:enamine deaminase RidA (YjgF/YER057c/UK114 family)
MEKSLVRQTLEQLGLTLPEFAKRAAAYEPYCLVGNLLFLSGQGARNSDNTLRKGRLGDTYDVEDGVADARTITLQLLATAEAALGSLDRIARVVKVTGMVSAVSEFVDHPKVIDGCSKLLLEVLDERGKHARTAMGVPSLPSGIAVEIEAIFEIRPD